MTCNCKQREEDEAHFKKIREYMIERDAKIAELLIPILEIGDHLYAIRLPNSIEINGKIYEEKS